MNCNEVRQHWNLYHDSEGDAELHFQIGEHLGMCPGCAEWFAQQSRLEVLLSEKLGSSAPTPELWDQVFIGSGLKKPARSGRWLLLAGMAACAVLAVAMLAHNSSRRTASDDLAGLTAERHQRLVEGNEPLPFQSQSDLEVEGYLRARVSFPVRCPPRKDVGFAVEGAGVCNLGEQPAAFLSGHVDQAPVSIFVLSRDSMAAFPDQQKALNKERPHRFRRGDYEAVLGIIDRNAVLVIGQAKSDQLVKVLNAYGTYPEPH